MLTVCFKCTAIFKEQPSVAACVSYCMGSRILDQAHLNFLFIIQNQRLYAEGSAFLYLNFLIQCS